MRPRVPQSVVRSALARRIGAPSLLAAGLLAASFAPAATAVEGAGPPPPVTGLTIFGDSLCDVGRYFAMTGEPGPPYFEGRFSNGPVWCEAFGPMLGLDEDAIENLAVGFATTGDVLALQVGPYVDAAGGPLDPAALHVVVAGANDFRLVIEDPTLDPVEVLEAAVANVAACVETLHAAGAQRFCVWNLPDLGTTPLVTSIGNPFITALATAVTEEFNEQLAAELDALDKQLGIELVHFDAFAELTAVIERREAFGFVDVVDRAFTLEGDVLEPVDGYLYWDDVHPTRAGHALVRDRVAALYGALRVEDVTRDGHVGFDDLVAVLAAWGGCTIGPCAVDVNDDGVVDALDLAAVTGAWDG